MATRWQGMGSAEAKEYKSERQDIRESSFKAGSKQGRESLWSLLGLGVLKKGVESWQQAGTTGLLNDTINRVNKDKYSMQHVLDKVNPYLVELSAQEEAATSIRDAGFDPNNDDDILAYYISKATGAKGKEFEELWKAYPSSGDLKVRRGLLDEYSGTINTQIKNVADAKFNKFVTNRHLFTKFKDPDSQMPLSTATIDRHIQDIAQRIIVTTDENIAKGHYINPSKFDGMLFQLGYNRNLRKDIIQGVKDETIKKGLVRRLDFKIQGTEVDENFEEMINMILTEWDANFAPKVPDSAKNELLDSLAIESNPSAAGASKEDLDNATQNLDIVSSIIKDKPSLAAEIGNFLIYKEDNKILNKEQRDDLVIAGLDELYELDYKLETNKLDFRTYKEQYDAKVLEIGGYRIKKWIKENSPYSERLNGLKDKLLNDIRVNGFNSLTSNQVDLYKALFPTSWNAMTASTLPKNLAVNTLSESFLNDAGDILRNRLGQFTNSYLESDLATVIQGQADKKVELGLLTENGKQQWIDERISFLSTDVVQNHYTNQLGIIKRALDGNPESLVNMSQYYAGIYQKYIKKGLQDPNKIQELALTDTLAAAFGVPAEGGWFGNPDRAFMAFGNPILGIGKNTLWAKLLDTENAYNEFVEPNADIARGAVTYENIIDKDRKKVILNTLSNFSDWENETGAWAVGTELTEGQPPASNRIKNNVQRYTVLRKFAEVLSEQDTELRNRIGPAIQSADALIKEAGLDYAEAYNQLRKIMVTEMTMSNVANNTQLRVELSGKKIIDVEEDDDDMTAWKSSLDEAYQNPTAADSINVPSPFPPNDAENGGTNETNEIPIITTATSTPSTITRRGLTYTADEGPSMLERRAERSEKREINKIEIALKEVNKILKSGKISAPNKSRAYFQIMDLPTKMQNINIADYKKVRDYLLELQNPTNNNLLAKTKK